MPESFDAFYARTVGTVTATMHELASGDPQADHAIREAYALAYQQWYEVSGYRDSSAWVLDAAKQAYERRRGVPLAADTGNETWPNMYRQPASAPVAEDVLRPAAPPAAALANAGGGAPGMAGPAVATPDGPGWSGYPGSPGAAAPAAPQPAGARTVPWAPGRGRPGDRRQLVALLAVVALLVAGVIGYLVLGRGSTPRASNQTPTSQTGGKPKATMLPAGRQGARSAVPWSLVGPGWTLAEVSTGQPNANGQPAGGGYEAYLVDPLGGRYLMYQWPAGSNQQLLAWSGNEKRALVAMAGGGYQLLDLSTGQAVPLTLPAGVVPAGFTRPDGLNILAVHQGSDRYKLQRYNLDGQFQATLATMPLRAGQPPLQGSCASAGCAAISSPNGDLAVWGTRGDQMQLVSNTGGHTRKLHVPGSNSCTPITWWDTSTVLATCVAGSPPANQARLWLVPADGSSPTPLTQPAGSPSGAGAFTGAWQAAGHMYATATSSRQCPGAATGPGGLGILDVSNSAAPTAVTISGTTNNYAAVLASSGPRLLVLAQTSCPGGSSLLWLTPSSGARQPLLTAAAGQAGVVAAVPFGNGPTALAG